MPRSKGVYGEIKEQSRSLKFQTSRSGSIIIVFFAEEMKKLSEAFSRASPPVKNRAGLLALCLVLFCMHTGVAGEFASQFNEMHSEAEATVNASRKLISKDARLVLVPIPISNPKIGTGRAVALLYFHGRKSEAPDVPNTTSGVFGMYTDSESWAAGGFHDGYYFDDRIRFRVPAAHGEFNLDFYGTENDSFFRDNPLKYEATGNVVIPLV